MAKRRTRRQAPPGWTEERRERLRQQRRQITLKEASKRGPFPVTVTKSDGVVTQLEANAKKLAYDRYMQSSRWAKRKVEYYQRNHKLCWRCGTTVGIHLHHHTYLRMGHELDEDLVPLCQTCHQRAHDLATATPGHDLTAATIRAIAEHSRHLVGFSVVLVPATEDQQVG